MHHDWILDVLSDLHDYATRNGMPDLARKLEEALALAELDRVAEAAEDQASRPAPVRRAH